MTHNEKARKIIQENLYMTLATTGKDSKPWAAPLFYVCDGQYRIYFASAIDSIHVQHITVNQNVSVAIYDSTAPLGQADGVQIEANAEQVPLTRLPGILKRYCQRRFPGDEWKKLMASFLGTPESSSRRMFEVKPVRVYTLNEHKTHRVEVNLQV